VDEKLAKATRGIRGAIYYAKREANKNKQKAEQDAKTKQEDINVLVSNTPAKRHFGNAATSLIGLLSISKPSLHASSLASTSPGVLFNISLATNYYASSFAFLFATDAKHDYILANSWSLNLASDVSIYNNAKNFI